MTSREDLSGRWEGMFGYPGETGGTAFCADLTDRGGRLSGRIVEPDLFSAPGAAIHAVLDGGREGSAVRFTKFYDDPAGNYDTVRYSGVVDASGAEIAGRWDIPGDWSGAFVMVRDVPVDATQEAAAADDMPLPPVLQT